MKNIFFATAAILSSFALFSGSAYGDDDSNLDKETSAQIQQIASQIGTTGSGEQKINQTCAFRGSISKTAMRLVIEKLGRNSVEGTITVGDEDPHAVSFEFSGQKQDVRVYSWWEGYFATTTIRLYLANIESGKQSITLEIRDGWFADKVKVTSVCHLDAAALEEVDPE
jgi:hypothetical protein